MGGCRLNTPELKFDFPAQNLVSGRVAECRYLTI